MTQAMSKWGYGGTDAAPQLTNNGDTAQLSFAGTAGDRSLITLTRLTSSSYWLTSAGSAGVSGNGTNNRAERRVSMVMRYSKPAIAIRGALTSYGSVTVKGSALVSGDDTPPTGWNAECASIPNKDTSAIAYAPGASVDVQNGNSVTGALVPDPVAGNLATYDTFGDQSWATLTAGADIILNGDVDPYPVGTMTSCSTSGAAHYTNWGEPERTSLMQGCKNYFPVIYSPRDLHLNSTARGQGILLVDGDLQVNGSLNFDGIIIVRGQLDMNGTADINGTVLSRTAKLTDTNAVLGNASITYSSCAAQRALSASAVLRPTTGRSWAPLD